MPDHTAGVAGPRGGGGGARHHVSAGVCTYGVSQPAGWWLAGLSGEWWCHSQLNGLRRDRQLSSAKSSQLSAAAKLVQLAQLAAGSGERGHRQQPSVAWGGALGGCSHR